MPYRLEQEANYKSHMRTYIYTYAHMQTCALTHTQHTALKKRKKTINKTTMIERAKQKWDLQLSSSFFGKCQVTNWTGLEGLRNVGFPQRTSLDLQKCSH